MAIPYAIRLVGRTVILSYEHDQEHVPFEEAARRWRSIMLEASRLRSWIEELETAYKTINEALQPEERIGEEAEI